MVKGFKDGSKKFHPISQSTGVRKKINKSIKPDGVLIRKKRDLGKTLDPDPTESFEIKVQDIIDVETERRVEILADDEEGYEELLNSGTDDVTAMGVTVGAGTFLKDNDPIKFRESLLNYADGESSEIRKNVEQQIDEEESVKQRKFVEL